MGDSRLAIFAISTVMAILVGIFLYLFSFAFTWWQIPVLIVLTWLGTFENSLGNRIWTTLIILAAIIILLWPILSVVIK